MRFGKLLVLRLLRTENSHSVFECRCDCDPKKTIERKGHQLKLETKMVKSCGCVKRVSPKFVDRTGHKIGRLRVLERVENKIKPDGSEIAQWRCICECNKEVIVAFEQAEGKGTRSCGCLNRDNHRLEYGLAAKRYYFRVTKAHAKRREIPWELSFEQFVNICEQNCTYCGSPPDKIQTGFKSTTEPENKHYGSWTHAGVDRTDCSKPYIINNAVPCCWRCNIMKMVLSVNDFQTQAKRIHDHKLGISKDSSLPTYRRLEDKIGGLYTYLNGRQMKFGNLKTGARLRGLDFSLTFEEFISLSEQHCTYCGVAPYKVQTLNRNGDLWTHGGIDRTDSNNGYVSGNCVPCCEICNVMKSELTQEQFYEHIAKIVRKTEEKPLQSILVPVQLNHEKE